MKLTLQNDIVRSNAIWDGDARQYRYALYRIWDESSPYLVVIGLNPSSADERYDDLTVRKCINLAKQLKYGALIMLNVFALRATSPNELKKVANPVGPLNDVYLNLMGCRSLNDVIVAWGRNGRIRHRHERVLELLHGKPLYCFGINNDGTPKHPLYLPLTTAMVRYVP